MLETLEIEEEEQEHVVISVSTIAETIQKNSFDRTKADQVALFTRVLPSLLVPENWKLSWW